MKFAFVCVHQREVMQPALVWPCEERHGHNQGYAEQCKGTGTWQSLLVLLAERRIPPSPKETASSFTLYYRNSLSKAFSLPCGCNGKSSSNTSTPW